MKIEVTEHDIKNGCVESLSYCPVALAVKRAYHLDKEDVEVGPMVIIIDDDIFTTPDIVFDFIQSFDKK